MPAVPGREEMNGSVSDVHTALTLVSAVMELRVMSSVTSLFQECVELLCALTATILCPSFISLGSITSFTLRSSKQMCILSAIALNFGHMKKEKRM
jgi:hypothetical protein